VNLLFINFLIVGHQEAKLSELRRDVSYI